MNVVVWLTRFCLSVVFALLVGSLIVAPAFSLTFEELDERIALATTVLADALAMPERGVPLEVLQRARAIAIFPASRKVGLVVGIQYGSGIILRRDEKTGWSKPAFFTIEGGSLGLQVGAQSTDLVLLIMGEESMERLLEDKLTFGADVSVAAGPVGRMASVETNIKHLSGILSYSRSKGIFAGISLTGASLEPDRPANVLYHGSNISVQDVLYENLGALSDNARRIVELLDRMTK